MARKQPESMDECLYFTNRTLGEKGHAIAWVFRKECPRCKKAIMGKPVEKGKVKTRAKEYVCPECGYTEDKKEHEESLNLEIEYVCPECGHSGDTETAYKRKSFKGVPAFVFECQGCGAKLGITKKMKAPKKKKAKKK